ncbi:hypothetical protein BJ170DRAFT_645622 [Xylariales sp. AK1849]|nr:hypothetical protein BJ170DRAFT_645622 [Xylariales sp. AK1849]
MASKSAMDELWDACETGNADRVRELFETSTLEAEDAHTCLGALVLENIGVDVTRALLDNGASAKRIRPPELRNCRSIDVFRLLAENGLDFKSEGHEILEDVVHSRGIIDFLLDQGVDINRPDQGRSSDGRRLPPSASGNCFDKTLGVLNNAAALGDIDLFDYLVFRGADVSKCIALHATARCPNPLKVKNMVTHLVDKYDFDPNADDNAADLRMLPMNADDYGRPLDFAIRYQNLAAVQALLQHGADPSIDDYLHVNNAMTEYPAAVERFLDAGADANVVQREAVRRDDVQIARLCLKHKANPSLILNAVADKQLVISPGMLALLRNE